MSDERPSQPSFVRLVALLPQLEAASGTRELVSIFYEDGLIVRDFDWPAWVQAEGRPYLETGAVEDADLETCRRLLMVLVRQDRFVEGSLRGAVQGGLVSRIVRQVADLTWRDQLQALIDEYGGIPPKDVDVEDFADRAEATGAPEDALMAFGSGLATYTLNEPRA